MPVDVRKARVPDRPPRRLLAPYAPPIPVIAPAGYAPLSPSAEATDPTDRGLIFPPITFPTPGAPPKPPRPPPKPPAPSAIAPSPLAPMPVDAPPSPGRAGLVPPSVAVPSPAVVAARLPGLSMWRPASMRVCALPKPPSAPTPPIPLGPAPPAIAFTPSTTFFTALTAVPALERKPATFAPSRGSPAVAVCVMPTLAVVSCAGGGGGACMRLVMGGTPCCIAAGRSIFMNLAMNSASKVLRASVSGTALIVVSILCSAATAQSLISLSLDTDAAMVRALAAKLCPVCAVSAMRADAASNGTPVFTSTISFARPSSSPAILSMASAALFHCAAALSTIAVFVASNAASTGFKGAIPLTRGGVNMKLS